MGRREFYAIVDETHRQVERANGKRPGSWEGYENNAWYQERRRKRGQKPFRGG